MATLIHHLGLGDHVMLNGLARFLVSKGVSPVHVIVLEHQVDTVSFMYRDEHRIKVLVTPSKNPNDVRSVVVGTPIPLATYSIPDATWGQLTFQGALGTWAHTPYLQAGVNPEYMRTRFKVVRDRAREQALFESLRLEGDPYVFVHRDPVHKPLSVRTDLRIVCPDTTSRPYNVFDWLLVIERATEVHCANGGPFMWIIELLKLGGPEKNFFHVSAAHTEYTPTCVRNVFTEDVWTFKD